MTMGARAVTLISWKQGMNIRSSTEAEVIAADEVVGSMVWTRLFLKAQGHPVKDNVLYQDNKSAMLLEEKGRQSAGKQSRHLNIWLFCQGSEGQWQYFNTVLSNRPDDWRLHDEPRHSKKFEKFRQSIMNLLCTTQLLMAAFVEETSEMVG
jgi:hypothetical protein